MQIKNYLIILSLASAFTLMPMQGFSAKTDTLHTRSAAMHKDIPAIVIIPDSYSASKSYPVLYLLHGYSGDAKDWTRVKALNELVDCYNMFVVLPDGGYSSWYLDSPVDSTWRYETYIINELIPFIDAHYNTVASTKGRAISGLSMGGHGALYLAFRHQDVFGAAGSTSGGVDIRPFPMNWDLPKRLGTYAEHPQNWEQNTIINMLHLLQPNKLALIIDCGTSDFFFDVNCHLHQELLYRNIPHDFIARPGAHTWEYWNNSILYQALFFHNFFRH